MFSDKYMIYIFIKDLLTDQGRDHVILLPLFDTKQDYNSYFSRYLGSEKEYCFVPQEQYLA